MSGPSLQDKLAAAQQDVEKWSQIAADPNLSPEAARVAQKAARSSAAAVRLYQKALAWQAEQSGKPEPACSAPASEPMSRANWIRGQTLAALSLAQREGASAAAPGPASSSKSVVPMSRADWIRGQLLAALSLTQPEGATSPAPGSAAPADAPPRPADWLR